jgi:hypothetical protein
MVGDRTVRWSQWVPANRQGEKKGCYPPDDSHYVFWCSLLSALDVVAEGTRSTWTCRRGNRRAPAVSENKGNAGKETNKQRPSEMCTPVEYKLSNLPLCLPVQLHSTSNFTTSFASTVALYFQFYHLVCQYSCTLLSILPPRLPVQLHSTFNLTTSFASTAALYFQSYHLVCQYSCTLLSSTDFLMFAYHTHLAAVYLRSHHSACSVTVTDRMQVTFPSPRNNELSHCTPGSSEISQPC